MCYNGDDTPSRQIPHSADANLELMYVTTSRAYFTDLDTNAMLHVETAVPALVNVVNIEVGDALTSNQRFAQRFGGVNLLKMIASAREPPTTTTTTTNETASSGAPTPT